MQASSRLAEAENQVLCYDYRAVMKHIHCSPVEIILSCFQVKQEVDRVVRMEEELLLLEKESIVNWGKEKEKEKAKLADTDTNSSVDAALTIMEIT